MIGQFPQHHKGGTGKVRDAPRLPPSRAFPRRTRAPFLLLLRARAFSRSRRALRPSTDAFPPRCAASSLPRPSLSGAARSASLVFPPRPCAFPRRFSPPFPVPPPFLPRSSAFPAFPFSGRSFSLPVFSSPRVVSRRPPASSPRVPESLVPLAPGVSPASLAPAPALHLPPAFFLPRSPFSPPGPPRPPFPPVPPAPSSPPVAPSPASPPEKMRPGMIIIVLSCRVFYI